jgi:uncharacterized membrane protein YhaH (DUF805 family)
MVNSELARDTPTLAGVIAINLLVVFIGGWLSFAMQVKRWHDLDKSGWLLLLNFTLIAIPIVVIILMCVRGTSGSNRFGGDPLSAKPVV